jgi:3-oxoacyl-[acyl-carrier-protein] synthase II
MLRDVAITGYGVVSAFGDAAQTWAGLCRCRPAVGRGLPTFEGRFPFGRSYAPSSFDPSKYIPRRADQRAMGTSMQYAVVAAGMALEQAGLLARSDLLDDTALLCAARFGERDEDVDVQIGAAIALQDDASYGATLNELLTKMLRPGLFLAQLPNLFAGNISLVFQLRGPSVTFVGDHAAGARTIVEGFDMIRHGEAEVVLAGGAFNGDEYQARFLFAGTGWLSPDASDADVRFAGGFGPADDGLIPGAGAAFVVLESSEHARARGQQAGVELCCATYSTEPREARDPVAALLRRYGGALESAGVPDAIIANGCGLPHVDDFERRFLNRIGTFHSSPVALTTPAPALGDLFHASAPLRVALAARAVETGSIFGVPPAPGRVPFERAAVVGEEPLSGIRRVAALCIGPNEGEFLAMVRASVSAERSEQ